MTTERFSFLKDLGRRFGFLPKRSVELTHLNFSEIPHETLDREWSSPDGKNIITLTVRGGREYGGTWMKDLTLLRKSDVSISKMEIFRVQTVVEPKTKTVEYNVYLDAFQDNPNIMIFAGVSYYWENNGKLGTPGSWAHPLVSNKYSHLEEREFRELLYEDLKGDMYHENELPEQIDLEATVVRFLDQIVKKDFSKPFLVPKNPHDYGIFISSKSKS